MAGNIVDVSTLATTLMELEHHGVKTAFALINAGYFNQENIGQLYRNGIAFLTRLPAGRVLYKQLILNHAQDLEKAEYAVMYGKRVLFRVHSIEAFRGYLMLHFLALILYLEFKKALNGKYTVEGALAELTNLMCAFYDREVLVIEPTKIMKEVFSLLGLAVPNSLGV